LKKDKYIKKIIEKQIAIKIIKTKFEKKNYQNKIIRDESKIKSN
jgi:hypothetical protein